MFLILIIAFKILDTSSLPEAAYTMFPGFDLGDWVTTTEVTTTVPSSTTTTAGRTRPMTLEKRYRSMLKTIRVDLPTPIQKNFTIDGGAGSPLTFTCPEIERPSNIGPYEVPTQRDLILLTLNTLHRMFGNYHRKTITFLDDISKVVRATEEVEKRCLGNRTEYRQCVKHITAKCATITDSIMTSLEQQRQDVLAFGDEANVLCSIEAMKADPVKLIKTLASEYASLDFSLPGFLRLVDTCAESCSSGILGKKQISSRQRINRDLVIRNFLTRVNYIRMLKPRRQNSPVVLIPILSKTERKP